MYLSHVHFLGGGVLKTAVASCLIVAKGQIEAGRKTRAGVILVHISSNL